MVKTLVPLITLGCFCVLASYSYGKIQPVKVASAKQGRTAKPVIIHAQGAAFDSGKAVKASAKGIYYISEREEKIAFDPKLTKAQKIELLWGQQ